VKVSEPSICKTERLREGLNPRGRKEAEGKGSATMMKKGRRKRSAGPEGVGGEGEKGGFSMEWAHAPREVDLGF